MSIKVILEQAKKNLEIEKDREIATVKDRVTRERILPFNQDIDNAREKAIQELQSKLNSDIIARQEKFAKEKQALIEAGEKKKKDNAEMVYATETSTVALAYDTAIRECEEKIAKL